MYMVVFENLTSQPGQEIHSDCLISSQKPLGRLICDITRISISWFSTSAIKNQKWWPLQRLEQFEDTKEAIRIRKSKNRQHNGQKRKKNRQHNGQKRKKNRQHNGQKRKNRKHNGQKRKVKRTNNDLQNIHIKLKIE